MEIGEQELETKVGKKIMYANKSIYFYFQKEAFHESGELRDLTSTIRFHPISPLINPDLSESEPNPCTLQTIKPEASNRELCNQELGKTKPCNQAHSRTELRNQDCSRTEPYNQEHNISEPCNQDINITEPCNQDQTRTEPCNQNKTKPCK